jgi:transcriptional regulator with XRE-family HTH domain
MTPLRLRLRELREAKKLSQLQLAESASVRQATISDLETGKSKGIDFATAEALAAVLGVEPHQLFETSKPAPKRTRR